MRLITTLGATLALSTLAANAASLPHAQPLRIRQDQVPASANSTGTLKPSGGGKLTDLVSWDSYTLSVLGQRVFVLSGEFHPWRLPSPDLWRDIVQKAKAAGFNTISIYLHWGASNPSDGTLDFDHFRAVLPIIELCKENGLWMVMRPGPYINAETHAGGIPGWVVALEGELRTNAPDYTAAWQGYMDYIGKLTAEHQISNGGPIIAVQVENEYFSTGSFDGKPDPRSLYMEALEKSLRSHGVDVPFMHNDASPSGNFVKGPGAVDLYGFDNYPQSFDCSNPYNWNPIPTTWHSNHLKLSPDIPFWIPEFQGGAFDPWGSSGGYPACNILTGPDFERVFYKGLWAANVKLVNYYMLYGGTSWGQLAFPGVYTSYDYGCAVSENRLLTPKYDELKLQGMFLRSAREFYKTDWVSDSTNTTEPWFTTFLHNPDTDSGFYFTRQTNTSSFALQEYNLQVNTSVGALTLPQHSGKITLNGRDHRLTVTDYHFGSHTLLYSTASIFLSHTIDGKDVLYVYADPNTTQGLEFAIKTTGNGTEPRIEGPLAVEYAHNEAAGYTTFNFTTAAVGLSSVQVSDDLLILVSDTFTATSFWSPTLQLEDSEWNEFYGYGTNETALISGPYLVRNASISGTELVIKGDVNSTVPLLVYAPSHVASVSFNGQAVNVTKNAWGAWEGEVEYCEEKVEVPALTGWKYKDSLPELQADYDDSRWTAADHTNTTNPFPPFNNSGPWILYANDYDFHQGNILWRGEFESNSNSSLTGVDLSISGGWAFAASAWLNDKYLGYVWSRNSTDAGTINNTYVFPEGAVVEGKNKLTVLQDHMGYYESWNLGNGQLDIKAPRGIQAYELQPAGAAQFTGFKVQGNLGGAKGYPDRTRGIYNEGGLYGERAGWHLPGFDDSDWAEGSPIDGIPKPGVGFFRTTFDLNWPHDKDIPINVEFGNNTFGENGGALRAQLYVNGYQFGKFVANIGPQTKFPIPRGVIDTAGKNTIALSIWGMSTEKKDLAVPDIYLTIDEVIQGGVGEVRLANPAWEKRDSY